MVEEIKVKSIVLEVNGRELKPAKNIPHTQRGFFYWIDSQESAVRYRTAGLAENFSGSVGDIRELYWWKDNKGTTIELDKSKRLYISMPSWKVMNNWKNNIETYHPNLCGNQLKNVETPGSQISEPTKRSIAPSSKISLDKLGDDLVGLSNQNESSMILKNLYKQRIQDKSTNSTVKSNSLQKGQLLPARTEQIVTHVKNQIPAVNSAAWKAISEISTSSFRPVRAMTYEQLHQGESFNSAITLKSGNYSKDPPFESPLTCHTEENKNTENVSVLLSQQLVFGVPSNNTVKEKYCIDIKEKKDCLELSLSERIKRMREKKNLKK